MLNYFIFNGESSLDYGIYVGGQETFNAPQRDVSKVSIPGRNGDLIKDNGRWLNVQVPYHIVLMQDFAEKADAVRAWLNEPVDYARLEDTYHPDYFRLARFTDTIEFETLSWNSAGKAVITFDCKPQRFLKSGEEAMVFQANEWGTSFYNPTRFASKPLIRIYGNGSGKITITNASPLKVYYIEVEDISEYIDIDCETMNCYKGSANCNNKVTLPQGFPQLTRGSNSVSWDMGESLTNLTSVEIKGRWYTI